MTSVYYLLHANQLAPSYEGSCANSLARLTELTTYDSYS